MRFRRDADAGATSGIHWTLDPNVIGVHLRCRKLDRRKDERGSRLEKVLPKLHELLDANPSRMLFVASDDDQMKDHLRAIWPERLITYTDVIQRRNSVDGVKHALRDLYTLGKSSFILTDGISTFGPMTARYENKLLKNMRKNIRTRGLFGSNFVQAFTF